MRYAFDIDVVNRKGEVQLKTAVFDVDGQQKMSVSKFILSESIAEALEKYQFKDIPFRKLIAWAIDLDKNSYVDLDDEERALFEKAIEQSDLLPFVKYQVFSVMEAKK